MRILLLALLALLAAAAPAQRSLKGGGATLRPDGRLPEGVRSGGWESDSVRKEGVPQDIHFWHIEPRFGGVRPVEADTMTHGFPNTVLTDGMRGEYNFTGNFGAPRLSRRYMTQGLNAFGSQFVFQDPYDFFLPQPGNILFTNTKSPFTNLTYHSCGNRTNGEDRISALFAVNAGRPLGVGFRLDYLYGRGYYDSQSTSQFGGTLFGSWRSERYEMHTYYNANHLKTTENGGVDDDRYITQPEAFAQGYGTADLPTRLSKAWNRLYVNTLYLTQRFNFGFERYRDASGRIVARGAAPDSIARRRGGGIGRLLSGLAHDSLGAAADTLSVSLRPDSLGTPADSLVAATDSPLSVDEPQPTREFVPVTSIVHTLRLDHSSRRFICNKPADDYFADFYLPGDSASDFTKNIRLVNTLALELREGFNRWMKTGIRLFAGHEFNSFRLPAALWPLREERFVTNDLFVGASLLKEQGRTFHYNVTGELRTSGTDWGEFNVEGTADVNLPLGRDTLRVEAMAFVRNETPPFYFLHYHGRNAWWDDEGLDKVFRTRIGGTLRYGSTRLSAHVETIQNYAYLAETVQAAADRTRYGVTVCQSPRNIQVVSATLEQDFRFGPLHWDSEVTWQATSDKDRLPLPALNIYSNLYLKFRIARVLDTEIGADIRYFTRYYAPAYAPVVGQFAVQAVDAPRVKLGNYPMLNAYVNFHLKRTRFYVMGSHLNFKRGAGMPFLVPHYPLNRLVIHTGISWNFWN